MFIPQDRLDKMQAIVDRSKNNIEDSTFWFIKNCGEPEIFDSPVDNWYFQCYSTGSVFLILMAGEKVVFEVDDVFLAEKDAYIEARRRLDDKIRSFDSMEVTA